jgi:benzylsuccinate CoA-transferase BbsE subunit/naphthyl-2-methylsuccinate CoA transferase subunit
VTGEGQQVDVSMQEAIAMALENSAQYYDLQGIVRKRVGVEGSQAGYGLYPCKDGYVYIMVAGLGGHKSWEKFVQWLSDENVENWELLNDPKWNELEWRQSDEGKKEFYRIFTQYSMKHTKLEIYEEGQRRQLAVCPVNDPKDVLENPQLKARDFFQTLRHEDLKIDVVYPGPPYRLSVTPWSLRHSAPIKGKHNAEIYGKLGYTAEDLRVMKEGGVI